VVRKMRRGEYDEFNDADLAREFSKYGVSGRRPPRARAAARPRRRCRRRVCVYAWAGWPSHSGARRRVGGSRLRVVAAGRGCPPTVCRISRHPMSTHSVPSLSFALSSRSGCARRASVWRQTVTRAEMTIDKENGWSKGFGFVSFSRIEEADAAMAAVHGSWMAGREMKVEKTHDN
jgi:RNA recognition motif-containing protein